MDRTQQINDGRLIVFTKKIGELNGTQNIMIYEPKNDTFTYGGHLIADRMWHLQQTFTPIVLKDGRVLIIGGVKETCMGYNILSNSAEIYDPVQKTTKRIKNMPYINSNQDAIILDDGRVLIYSTSLNSIKSNFLLYIPKK